MATNCIALTKICRGCQVLVQLQCCIKVAETHITLADVPASLSHVCYCTAVLQASPQGHA